MAYYKFFFKEILNVFCVMALEKLFLEENLLGLSRCF